MDTIENMISEVNLTDTVTSSTEPDSDVNGNASSLETNKSAEKTSKKAKAGNRFKVDQLPFDSWHLGIRAFRVRDTTARRHRRAKQGSTETSAGVETKFSLPAPSKDIKSEGMRGWFEQYFKINAGALLKLAKKTRDFSAEPIFTHRTRGVSTSF